MMKRIQNASSRFPNLLRKIANEVETCLQNPMVEK